MGLSEDFVVRWRAWKTLVTKPSRGTSLLHEEIKTSYKTRTSHFCRRFRESNGSLWFPENLFVLRDRYQHGLGQSQSCSETCHYHGKTRAMCCCTSRWNGELRGRKTRISHGHNVVLGYIHNRTRRFYTYVANRVNSSKLDLRVKHPIIMHRSSHIATLLVRHYHKEVTHQGRYLSEGAIWSVGYWTIGGKRFVSSIIHQCVICRKLHGPWPIVGLDALEAVRPTANAGTSSSHAWQQALLILKSLKNWAALPVLTPYAVCTQCADRQRFSAQIVEQTSLEVPKSTIYLTVLNGSLIVPMPFTWVASGRGWSESQEKYWMHSCWRYPTNPSHMRSSSHSWQKSAHHFIMSTHVRLFLFLPTRKILKYWILPCFSPRRWRELFI